MKRKLLLAIAGLIAIVLGGFYYYTTTPTYSILQIRKAIQEHDVALFEKHVDTDTLFTRLIDDVVAQQITKESASGSSSAGALGTAIGASMVQMIKPALVSGMKSSTQQFVETGSWTKNKGSAASSAQLRGLGEDTSSVSGIASSIGVKVDQLKEYRVNAQGKVAYVTIPYFSEDLEQTLEMKFSLRDQGGYWQLVQFNNAAELFDKVRLDRQRRVDEANKLLSLELHSAVHAVGAEKSNTSDHWEINKKVTLQVDFESAIDKPVTTWEGIIQVLDSDLKPIISLNSNANFEGKLQKGKPTSLYWQVSINQFMDGHPQLWAAPKGKINVAVTTTKVGYTDGSSTKLLSNYSELHQLSNEQ